MAITKYKAAAVTSEPGWFDLEGGVRKTIDFINEAGEAGCKFVAFPEVWIPGYPYWMWKVTYLQSLPMLKRYRENSMAVDSEEMRRIRRAARDNQIFVSLGFSEIDHATLYLSQVLIGPDGARHQPPPQDQAPLMLRSSFTVMDPVTPSCLSVRLRLAASGQLNCWENMNPFLKSLNVSAGEQVHVAAWPVYPGRSARFTPTLLPTMPIQPLTWLLLSMLSRLARGLLLPSSVSRLEGLKINTPEGVEPETDPSVYNGHARIYRPDGSLVVKPEKDFDGLLFVDIDLNECHLTKVLADFAGHYMRPDLIRLLVDTRRKKLITEADPNGSIATYSTRQRLGLDSLFRRRREMRQLTCSE
nr:cyanide hydratase [Fusarium lateritium]